MAPFSSLPTPCHRLSRIDRDTLAGKIQDTQLECCLKVPIVSEGFELLEGGGVSFAGQIVQMVRGLLLKCLSTILGNRCCYHKHHYRKPIERSIHYFTFASRRAH